MTQPPSYPHRTATLISHHPPLMDLDPRLPDPRDSAQSSVGLARLPLGDAPVGGAPLGSAARLRLELARLQLDLRARDLG